MALRSLLFVMKKHQTYFDLNFTLVLIHSTSWFSVKNSNFIFRYQPTANNLQFREMHFISCNHQSVESCSFILCLLMEFNQDFKVEVLKQYFLQIHSFERTQLKFISKHHFHHYLIYFVRPYSMDYLDQRYLQSY